VREFSKKDRSRSYVPSKFSSFSGYNHAKDFFAKYEGARDRMKTFPAQWNQSTYFFTCVGLFGAILLGATGFNAGRTTFSFTLAIVVAIPVLCYALAPRRYKLTSAALYIERNWGVLEVPLSQLQRARLVDPMEIEKCSWRFPMNGGLFGFVGRFHTPAFGTHEWIASRDQDLVLLQTRNGPIVISPSNPVEFVAAVNAALRG
jgi:hypothetical protein